MENNKNPASQEYILFQKRPLDKSQYKTWEEYSPDEQKRMIDLVKEDEKKMEHLDKNHRDEYGTFERSELIAQDLRELPDDQFNIVEKRIERLIERIKLRKHRFLYRLIVRPIKRILSFSLGIVALLCILCMGIFGLLAGLFGSIEEQMDAIVTQLEQD